MQAHSNKHTQMFSSSFSSENTRISSTFYEAYQYFTICSVLKIIYLILKLTTSLYFIIETTSQHIYFYTGFIFIVGLLQIVYFSKLTCKLMIKSNLKQIANFLDVQLNLNSKTQMEGVFTINNENIQYLQQNAAEQTNLKSMVSQIENYVHSVDNNLSKLRTIQMMLDKLMQGYGLCLLILLESIDKWDKVYVICVLYIGMYEYMQHYLIFLFKAAEYVRSVLNQLVLSIKKKFKFYSLHLGLRPVTYNKDIQGSPECRICLSAYMNSDKILILKCSPLHHFHYECIEEWMANSITCPICRGQIRTQ